MKLTVLLLLCFFADQFRMLLLRKGPEVVTVATLRCAGERAGKWGTVWVGGTGRLELRCVL